MLMRGEEKELWEKVEPYIMAGGRLREDAPDDVVKAAKRLHEISWDVERMQ